ncbi:hypothetical protein EDC04DRAFT_3136189 [Pisolithus marmoratus]|nr:hypothetical protein EDC04DRAFT_3136189 [Pisolithus marmoratus]
MHSKTLILSLLDHAPPSTSTVQPTQSLASQENCPPSHHCCATAPDYEFSIINGWEPQCPILSASDICTVSSDVRKLFSTFNTGVLIHYSQPLQLSSCPTIANPILVSNSSLVHYLNEEQNSAQVALSSGYLPRENGPPSIVSAMVSPACGCWGTQDHISDHVMNHNATPSSPYTTNLLQLYAIGQLSRYSQESGNLSTFEHLYNGSTGPMMGLCSIPFHDHVSGQIESNAIYSPLLPPFQNTHSLDYLTSENLPLFPERIQAETATPAQFLSSPTTQPINQTHLTPFAYACPTLSQPNSYSSADNYTPRCLSVQIPNQVPCSQSQSPQERLGSPFPTFDNRTAHTLSNHPLSALSDQGVHPSSNHATYLPDDHTAGTTHDYGNSDKIEFNYEQVVNSRPRSSPPPIQPLPSPHELHSHGHVSRIEGGNQNQSRTLMRLPKARSVYDRNLYKPCGWRGDNGRKCGMLIKYDDCAGHFAAVHDIENITWNAQIFCQWCSSETQRKVIRKNFLRHLREVHLRYPRSEKGI